MEKFLKINLDKIVKWTLPGLFFIPSSCAQKAKENIFPDKPNIVFIIADDMNWDDCGAYGHPHIRTPNIDRMAENGMKFTNAFLTISSCSPSRASLITGLYPHQTDAEQLHWHVPDDKITVVEKLKEAGYWTAQAGKLHLGNYIPERFDFVASEKAFREAGADGKTLDLPPNDRSGAHLWVSTLRHRPENQPFFMWFAAIDPHRPYEKNIIPNPHGPEDIIIPPYMPDTPKVREDFAMYYDEISRMDDYIGQVVEELKRQGILENTLILVISDNGRPFPRDKTTLYDGGIKTPFIIQWPAVVEPGTVSHSLVSGIDIATTFLRLAGTEPGENFIGKDFSPILVERDTEIREHIFAQAFWHDHERMYRAVRDKRYKYIRNYFPDLPNTPPADALKSMTWEEMMRLKDEGNLNEAQMNVFISPTSEEELYDLENDPFELNNLIGLADYEALLTRMRDLLKDNMTSTNDSIPEKRTPDEFDRVTGDPLPAWRMPRIEKFDQ